MCFSSSHIWKWELDYKESWVQKNWCFCTVVLEKTLGSPLDCKEIKPVNLKGYQSWIFIGRTNAEAETPILWPPDAKNWFIGKDPNAGKDWKQEEKGGDRGWDGWMALLTWWTSKPGMLQSTGSQRVRHNWATELKLQIIFEIIMFLQLLNIYSWSATDIRNMWFSQFFILQL